MWLLCQVQVDPTSVNNLGPFAAFATLALGVIFGLWKMLGKKDKQIERLNQSILEVTREVTPVLTTVTEELRRFIDRARP